MTQEFQTQFDDLHQRFDVLERMATDSNRLLTERVARGFLATQRGGDSSPSGVAPATLEVDYGQVKAVLETEREAFQDDLKKALPRELLKTLRRLRTFLWATSFLLLLSGGANIYFMVHLRNDVIKRTPTRMQIEMMRRGWEQLRSEEKSHDAKPSNR